MVMIKATRMALALLIVIASLSAAQPALAAPPADDKKPDVKLKSFVLNRVDWINHAADATVAVEIYNPGPEFKVKDVSYHLKLNGQVAAEGKYKNEVKVPAASKVTIDLPLTVKLSTLPAVTWSTLTEGFKLSYELDAEFTVPVFALFSHRVKAVFSGELTPESVMSSMSSKAKEQSGIKP
jgi:LEA14-like dessication related protein